MPLYRKRTSVLSLRMVAVALVASLPFQPWHSGQAGSNVQSGSRQEQSRERTLDEPVERETAGGQADRYQLVLSAGQYVQIAVELSGIGLTLVIVDPEGREMRRAELSSGVPKPPAIYWVARSSGAYRLEMIAPEKAPGTGRYRLKVEALRIATQQDGLRSAWSEILAAGERLKMQATAASLRAAILKYQEALHYLHDADEPAARAETLRGLSLVYYQLGETKKALDALLQELPLRRTIGDRGGESQALNNIGLVYGYLGEAPKALEYLKQSLQLNRTIGDRQEEATTLNNLGIVYKSLGELRQALDYYEQSLSITQTLGDQQAAVLALNNIGTIYASLGEKQKTLDYYSRSLAILRTISDRQGEAEILNNLGLYYDGLGEKQKALDHYDQSLPLARASGNRRLEAFLLNNLGLTYYSLGENRRALDYYHQSLPIFQAVADPQGETMVLNNLGLTYKQLGEFQKALDYYSQSLGRGRATGNRDGEALALNNLGGVYNSLGESQKALDHFLRALQLRREIGNRNQIAVTLHNIGSLYRAAEDKQKARDYFQQALSLYRAVGNRSGEASTLINLGVTLDSPEERRKALEYFEQALRLKREVKDSRGQVTALNNRGSIYIDLGDEQKALESLHSALQLARTIGDRSGEARALYNFARLEQQRGDLTAASSQIEAALRIIEALRSKVDIQELRATYLASMRNYYELYLDLLAQLYQASLLTETAGSAGYRATALEACELARARSLLEILAEARADIREGVDPQLLERERALQERLSARASAQTAMLNRQQIARHLSREIEDLTTRLQEVKAEILARSPRYAALTQPQPLKVREIQGLLDQETILLEYFLGRKQSYLWAVTQTSIDLYRLPPRAEIEDAAREFYRSLTARGAATGKRGAGRRPAAETDSQSRSQAARLSRMVLGPAASQLGKKRLVIVPDGALQYIPFAALPAPSASTGEVRNSGAAMVIEHEIVNLPSASSLAALRQETSGRIPAAKSVAVLADPVFTDDDTRVRRHRIEVSSGESQPPAVTEAMNVAHRQITRSGQETGAIGAEPRFARLLGTRREAAAILALVPESERRQFLDFEASRATALSPELGQYRILHFATHGLLNNIHPELSGIVLSLVNRDGQQQNGFLQLHDVYNLKLPAELVVLSACQTGLGKEVKGEGLIGLTRGFMYAGTLRVVASLWNVDDQATGELMKRFYQGLLGPERLRPAEALRQAQLSILRQRQWRAPYYWAAFVLQGEWR